MNDPSQIQPVPPSQEMELLPKRLSSVEPTARPVDLHTADSTGGSLEQHVFPDPPCRCVAAVLAPHRASRCKIFQAIRDIAPGIFLRNESNITILVVLSQLSPLHWAKVLPGTTEHIKCGKVFFTISTDVYDPLKVPTRAEVALRIGVISGLTLLSGGLVGVGIAGGISGITSQKKNKIDGIYADGKTIVVTGNENLDSGVYDLYFKALELSVKHAYADAQPRLASTVATHII